MKRILLFLLCAASFATACCAQAERSSPVGKDDDTDNTKTERPALRIPTGIGNMMVGTNLLLASIQFQKGTDPNFDLGIGPKLAFFVLPNIAIGLNLDLGIQEQKAYRAISYGVQPFSRIYFSHDNSSRSRPLQFFFEAGVGYGGVNTRTESGSATTDVSTNGLRVYALPGLDYFLNDHVALETGLQYTFNGGKPDAHIVALNLGFQVFLGR